MYVPADSCYDTERSLHRALEERERERKKEVAEVSYKNNERERERATKRAEE